MCEDITRPAFLRYDGGGEVVGTVGISRTRLIRKLKGSLI